MTTTQKSVVDMYLEGKSFDVRCSDTLYPLSNGSAPSEGDDGYLRVLDNGLSCPWPHTIYYVHHTSWQTLGRGTEGYIHNVQGQYHYWEKSLVEQHAYA